MSTDGTPDPPVDTLDAGALLEHRDFIKVTTQSFPAGLTRQVLHAMDERRRSRRLVPETPPELPQMSLAEMRREIVWRLATLPPDDAEAIAALVRRLAPRTQ